MRKVLFEIHDPHGEPHNKVTGEIEIGSEISIRFDQYGTATAPGSEGQPVVIEFYQGELRVLVWDDINQEDPKVISLELANAEMYEGEE